MQIEWLGGEDFKINRSIEKDEKNRNCIGSIDVHLSIDVPEEEQSPKRLERGQNILSQRRFFSRSLEKGIKTSYSLVTQTI